MRSPALSIAFGIIIVLVLNQILRGFGLEKGWRYPVLLLFVLNPLVLSSFAQSSPAVISTSVITLAAKYFLDWQRTDALQPMVLLGFTAGLAGLFSFGYTLYVVVLIATIWLHARQQESGRPARTQALIIAYFTPAAFVIVGGLLFTALLADQDPVLPASRLGIISASDLRAIEPVGVGPAATVTFWQLVSLFPFFVIAIVALIGDHVLTRHQPSLCLALLAVSLPVMGIVPSRAAQSVVLYDDYLPIVPFGYIVGGYLMTRYNGTKARLASAIKSITFAGLAFSGLASGRWW